ncbi:MAG: FKBP-type peptidyl-prolyl cis-trans isomerase [Victivallales bacterium]|nr:FKBP-type peptidyl-prolyl cis-trans isomerase [Victivallales bacterium]
MKLDTSIKRRPVEGDPITIAFTCKDSQGNEMVSTLGPYELVLGDSRLCPALTKRLKKMLPGESCSFSAKAAEAFGPVKDELFIDVPFSALDDGEGYEPKLDDYVELDVDDANDGPLGGIIVDISEETVLVDCNHPMAGKTAFFELTFHGFTAQKPAPKKKK